MIVSALRREASTSLSRSCPSDQRLPEPERSGARSPWNFCSGNGPLWHRMQVLRPFHNEGTPARRVASRLREQFRNGIANNNIVAKFLRRDDAGQRKKRAGKNEPDMRCLLLAKDFRRDRGKPGLGVVGLARAEIGRHVRRADAAGARDVGP